MTSTINTRADLDALRGTPEHVAALIALRGSMIAMINVAVYPEGYFGDDYPGPAIEPVWEETESLEALTLLGMSRSEFVAEWNAAFPGEPME